MRVNPWLILSGLSGLISVLAGAYGYHWIEYDEVAQRDLFNMGVQYQMWHSLALLAVAVLWDREPTPRRRRVLNLSGAGFTLGILCFCGSLYVFGLTLVLIPGVAPFGGFCLMAGWLALIWTGARRGAQKDA
ncbi:MAG: DUF423 domain-containing protein [Magnetospiraceae bacterium]